MPTPPYAQGGDLVARFDVRILGQICEDAGTPVAPSSVPTDPNVLTALTDAASMINAACQVGQRYTQAELAALTGTDQALLFRLNCDLAFVYLAQRRGITPPGYKEAYDRSTDLLDRLKVGEMIFNVAGDVASGNESINFMSQTQYNTLQLLRDATPKLFPIRRRQNPVVG